MTETRPDRRPEKTREALLAAFRDLVTTQGYSGLTIGQIVERANVGRSTFYEHFTGKPELLGESLRNPFGSLAATVDPGRQPAEFAPLLAHFREQRRWAQVLFAGPTRKLLTRKLAERIEERLKEAVPDAKPALPLAVLAFQLAGSHLALLEGWVWGNVSCSAEVIATAFIDSGKAAVTALKAG